MKVNLTPKQLEIMNNDFNTLLNEVKELNQMCNISKLISIIRQLKSQLQNCNDNFERLVVLSNIID